MSSYPDDRFDDRRDDRFDEGPRDHRTMENARSAVRIPATLLIVTGALVLIGAVLSTPLAASATAAWYLPRLTLRVLQADWRSMRDALGRLLWFAAAMLLAAGLGRAVAASLAGYRGAAAGALFTALCGAALMWAVLLDAPVRARLAAWRRCFLVGAPAVAAPVVVAGAD